MGEERGNFRLYLASFGSPYQFPSSVFYSPEAEGGKRHYGYSYVCGKRGHVRARISQKKVRTRRGIICGAGGGNSASISVFPRKIGFYSREKIILSLLLRGMEGSGRPRLEAPGVLFSVLKRRKEAKMVIWQTNRRRRRTPPSPPRRRRKGGLNLERVFPM